MEREHIGVELKRADDDLPAQDALFLKELDEFARLLRLAGVAYSRQGEGDHSSPQFLVTLSPEVVSTFSMILMTWFLQRTGRSIRVTLFDDDVQLQSARDFEDFVERIKQRRIG
jgi:hypothetical protein